MMKRVVAALKRPLETRPLSNQGVEIMGHAPRGAWSRRMRAHSLEDRQPLMDRTEIKMRMHEVDYDSYETWTTEEPGGFKFKFDIAHAATRWSARGQPLRVVKREWLNMHGLGVTKLRLGFDWEVFVFQLLPFLFVVGFVVLHLNLLATYQRDCHGGIGFSPDKPDQQFDRNNSEVFGPESGQCINSYEVKRLVFIIIGAPLEA